MTKQQKRSINDDVIFDMMTPFIKSLQVLKAQGEDY